MPLSLKNQKYTPSPIDRDRPSPAFIQYMRDRYPTEREIDWAFTRRMERRASGPFKMQSLEDLVNYLKQMLKKKSKAVSTLRTPRGLAVAAPNFRCVLR